MHTHTGIKTCRVSKIDYFKWQLHAAAGCVYFCFLGIYNRIMTSGGEVPGLWPAPKSYGWGSFIWLVVSNVVYFPFHIWDVILPIDELRFFKMVVLWKYLVGGLEHFLFSPIVGMMIQSDELIFFRGVGIPPTSKLVRANHHFWIGKPSITGPFSMANC